LLLSTNLAIFFVFGMAALMNFVVLSWNAKELKAPPEKSLKIRKSG